MRSIIACVVICAAFGCLTQPRRTCAEPDSLEDAVAKLVRHGLLSEKGMALGVRGSEAFGAMKGGTSVVGEGYTALAASGLPGSVGLNGVVRFTAEELGEPNSPIDTLVIEVVAPPYDRSAMTKRIERVITDLGLALETDDDDPHVYWCERKVDDEEEIERTLWFGLGERIIVLEFDEDGRETPIANPGKKPK